MINCFPIMYEDEILYSIIARYKRMCGISSKKALIRDLFGTEVTLSSAYFPTHLKDLTNNLTYKSKINEDILLNEHTLYPLFTSFLAAEATNDINGSVKEGRGQRVVLKLGFTGRGINMSEKLKFCPECFKEDITTLGESYWRRLHQVPGVFFCIKHGCQLLESTVNPSDSRISLECADENKCKENQDLTTVDDEYKKLNIKFGMEVECLLNNALDRKDLSFIVAFYIDRLRDMNLASDSGNIYMNKLENQFIDFYSDEYLRIMNVGIDRGNKSNWLRLFVRSNNKNRNHVKHILFLQFLGVKAEDLFNCNRVVGRKSIEAKHNPILNKKEMRQKWRGIVSDNPNVSRTELKEIGKGVYTWLYRHDREWLKATLTPLRIKRGQKNFVNWEERDKECLEKSKVAVEEILRTEGKPVRICKAAIRRQIGANTWFNNKKLVKTHIYTSDIEEDIESYRIRKIRWAINEMLESGGIITPYKVQIYAGFGGNNGEVRGLIEEELLSD